MSSPPTFQVSPDCILSAGGPASSCAEKRLVQSALSVVAVTVAFVFSGCTGPGYWYREVGIGVATEWSVPSGIQAPSRTPVVSISVGDIVSGDMMVVDGKDMGTIFVASGSLEIGAILTSLSYSEHLARTPLLLAPEIGIWFTDGTSEHAGLFTGLKVGVGFVKHGSRDRSVILGYRWLTLHGVSDDEKTRMQIVSVRYAW